MMISILRSCDLHLEFNVFIHTQAQATGVWYAYPRALILAANVTRDRVVIIY
jgi:hypothetical protein